MFLGLSKNIGGGFRLGIGTRINLNQNNNNKISKKDEQEEEFITFINSMNEKSLNSIKKFIENSGYDFNKLSNAYLDKLLFLL
jgi:Ethanolamine utilization protein EutJ (predicted chaperonin)